MAIKIALLFTVRAILPESRDGLFIREIDGNEGLVSELREVSCSVIFMGILQTEFRVVD